MGCSEKSELRKTEIREGLYSKREISKDYTLYWRVLPDTQEIEIAMKVKGKYWYNMRTMYDFHDSTDTLKL